MATNNFKLLEDEAEKQHPHAPEEIENNLMGSMRMTHFMGNVVELYLPRLFEMILSLFSSPARYDNSAQQEDLLNNDSDEGSPGDSKSDL